MQDQDDGEELMNKIFEQPQKKVGNSMPKSVNFDIFAASDDEDDGNVYPPIDDADILPEIIKDDEFEGQFDLNTDGKVSNQQRDTQNTDNTEGENSNTSDDAQEGEEGLAHLKMANCEFGRKKKIDVRKGLSVEKNVRFDE